MNVDLRQAFMMSPRLLNQHIDEVMKEVNARIMVRLEHSGHEWEMCGPLCGDDTELTADSTRVYEDWSVCLENSTPEGNISECM